ncbi:hypothetical protein G3480_21255 [Thiorhodococcus mannitoliphagus]|uniref:Uncharacterized protein n=1 Tax=Thiorhodococcus mannitoliphagus TaxID=329406 RepID=A0A6P1DYP8_9GAMM|nr:hypothetical protein [Thiorhodococcus mannitoliphagus]NEX22799.1 hypothetical protein [Thiorhodococcus mannitoliphagus]
MTTLPCLVGSKSGGQSLRLRMDEGLTQTALPHGNLLLDGRDVDVVLDEFLVDLLELSAVPFILRPPEPQGDLSAFVHQGLHLRNSRLDGFGDPPCRRMDVVRWNMRACAH